MQHDYEFPEIGSIAKDAISKLSAARANLRQQIADSLDGMDPTAPETLQFAIIGMSEAHFKPKDLSALLGPSQTTIGRWAMGQTIPRSPPYRKWLVETILAYLRTGNVGPREPQDPDRDAPPRPDAKRAKHGRLEPTAG